MSSLFMVVIKNTLVSFVVIVSCNYFISSSLNAKDSPPGNIWTIIGAIKVALEKMMIIKMSNMVISKLGFESQLSAPKKQTRPGGPICPETKSIVVFGGRDLIFPRSLPSPHASSTSSRKVISLHSITLSFYHSINILLYHSITLSLYYSIILTLYLSISPSLYLLKRDI